MPLEKDTYYRIVCNDCGDVDAFSDEGYGYPLAEDEKQAKEIVEMAGGHYESAEVMYCEPCMDERERPTSPSPPQPGGDEQGPSTRGETAP